MINKKYIEFKRYEECITEYKALLKDLTLIKEGENLFIPEFEIVVMI
ncbi:MAG: hypothetical protein PHY59_05325 [Methanobacterium sp.]|nr:hypothetical protein [Methanobacterium sp.]